MLTLKNNRATVEDVLSVEDAELLFEWSQEHPRGSLDLGACTHVHTASLQVLMATRIKIAVWPQAEALAEWLHAALDHSRE